MVIHLKVIEAGGREKRTFSFLSTKEIECPRCGRVEHANADQR